MENELIPADGREAEAGETGEACASPPEFEAENGPAQPSQPEDAGMISPESDPLMAGRTLSSPESGLPDDEKDNVLMDGVYRAVAKMEVIQHQLGLLHQQFDTKFKYDAHKEKIIDNLHKELQQYKSSFFSKQEHSMTMDMIKIIDDIKKFANHYRSLESDKRNPEKLFDYLEQIPSDLEDLFLLRGITPYQEVSLRLNPVRQRIAQKIATPDPLQDKTIAASLRPGYECDGRIIRPEMVAVYVYEPPTEEVQVRNLNE